MLDLNLLYSPINLEGCVGDGYEAEPCNEEVTVFGSVCDVFPMLVSVCCCCVCIQ
jgi:hypothetical protein